MMENEISVPDRPSENGGVSKPDSVRLGSAKITVTVTWIPVDPNNPVHKKKSEEMNEMPSIIFNADPAQLNISQSRDMHKIHDETGKVVHCIFGETSFSISGVVLPE